MINNIAKIGTYLEKYISKDITKNIVLNYLKKYTTEKINKNFLLKGYFRSMLTHDNKIYVVSDENVYIIQNMKSQIDICLTAKIKKIQKEDGYRIKMIIIENEIKFISVGKQQTKLYDTDTNFIGDLLNTKPKNYPRWHAWCDCIISHDDMIYVADFEDPFLYVYDKNAKFFKYLRFDKHYVYHFLKICIYENIIYLVTWNGISLSSINGVIINNIMTSFIPVHISIYNDEIFIYMDSHSHSDPSIIIYDKCELLQERDFDISTKYSINYIVPIDNIIYLISQFEIKCYERFM